MAKANRHMMKKKQSLKSQSRRTNFVFAFLLLAVFFVASVLPASAATGVMVGSDSLILGSGENIYYGAFSPSSNAGASGMLIQSPIGNNIFRLDTLGNVTATGTLKGMGGLCIGNDCRTAWDQIGGAFWNLNGSNLYASSTEWNLGIGITNPISKLHVVGATGLINTGAIQFSALGGAGNVLVMSDNAGNLYSTTTAAVINPIVTSASGWTANGTTVYKTDTNGNVGIGTTNPRAPFEIYKDGVSNIGSFLLDQPTVPTGSTSKGPHFFFKSGGIDRGWFGFFDSVAHGNGTALNLRSAGDVRIGASIGSAPNMIIKVGGNVGIGTTNPLETLQVEGNLRFDYSANGDGILGYSSVGNQIMSITRQVSPVNATLAINSYGALGFKAGNTTGSPSTDFNMTIDTSGSVGIGTTTPATKLDVIGGGSFRNDGATTHTLLGGSGNVLVMADNAGGLYGVTSPEGTAILPTGTSGQTLRHNGTAWIANTNLYNDGTNVGVGTSNPSVALETRGQLLLNMTTASGNEFMDWPNPALAIRRYETSTNQMKMISLGYRDDPLYQAGNSVWYFGIDTGAETSRATSSASTDLEIGGPADVHFINNGNVGIGTTNPGTSKLNVTGTANGIDSLVTIDNSAGAGRGLFINSNGTTNVSLMVQTPLSTSLTTGRVFSGAIQGESWGRFMFYSDGKYGIGPGNADRDIFLSRNSANTLKVSSDGANGSGSLVVTGRIGISTTSPASKLQIVAGSDPGFINSGSTQLSALGGAGNVLVAADNTGTLYSTGLSIGGYWNANGTHIYNNNTGNVGIGTTSPGSKLEIVGSGGGSSDGILRLSMSTGGGIRLTDTRSSNQTDFLLSATDYVGGAAAGVFAVTDKKNNATRLLINSSGNIGIGVTNPQEKLEVSGGSIRINSGDSWKSAIIKDGNGATIFRGLRGNPYWSDNPANSVGFNVGSPGDNIVFTTANSIIAPRMMAHTSGFQVNGGAYNLASAPAGLFEVTNGATKLFDILSNGRVGISTTSPAAKLQIVASPDPGFINSGSTQLSALGGAGNVLVAADNTGTLYSTGLSVGGYWTANGNHIYNNNSANVGIGATNPVQKLEVANGNIKLSANSYIQGNSAGGTGNGGYVMFTGEAGANAGYGVWLNQNAIWNGTNWLQPRGTLGSLMFTSNHHLGWSWRFAGAGGADGGNITPNEVANLNSSGRLQIDGVLNVDGTASSYIQGRVGITTTTPAAKLQIVASPDPGFINSGSTQLSALGGAGNVLVAADNTGTLYSTGLSIGGYWNANGNHIYNNNTANVGIGTTTPTAKLEVFGDIKSSVVGSSAVFTAYNPGTNYPRALFKVGNSTSDINTGLMFAPEYTSAGITKPFSLEIYNNKFNADSSARMVGLGVYATYSSIHSLGPNGNSAGLPLIFSTQTYSGNNPAIYISNAAAQNVGIGTSTPANKLVVSNNGASYIQISGSGGAGAQSGIKLTSNYGVTANSELNFDYFGSYASSTTGSVGHGVNLISGRAAPFGNFWFRNSTNNVGAAFVDPSYSGSNMGTFASMNLLVGGNVGIGTTTPASKLHLVGATGFINTGVNQLSALANSGNVLVMADDNGVLYATSTAGFLGGGTSGSDYWALAGSSLTASSTTWNVGIGTTNPGAKLTLGNDQWFGAINAAGTATANMFKLNTNNQIEVGSPLLIGPLELAQDGGYLTFIDMPVTSAAASSTVQGYSLRLDGNSLLNLYSRSNGTGGVADLGVGIGITNPSAALHVVGSTALIVNGAIQFASLGNSGQVFLMADNDGNLYATSSPTQLTGNYLPLTGGTLTGDLNMSGNDIDAVNKLTVNTIDPLYKIKGINYSTFVASVVGGVKEEYIGRAELKKVNANGEYEQVIDFAKQKEGSDLWVWRKVVDFSRDNVDVLMTAYGRFAQVYYLIDGEKLIFRSDKPTVVSYRLVGQRIDWRSWPTRAIDQQETPGFIID